MAGSAIPLVRFDGRKKLTDKRQMQFAAHVCVNVNKLTTIPVTDRQTINE